jgi:hypothetical protein
LNPRTRLPTSGWSIVAGESQPRELAGGKKGAKLGRTEVVHRRDFRQDKLEDQIGGTLVVEYSREIVLLLLMGLTRFLVSGSSVVLICAREELVLIFFNPISDSNRGIY